MGSLIGQSLGRYHILEETVYNPIKWIYVHLNG